jgi:hypothetical protein
MKSLSLAVAFLVVALLNASAQCLVRCTDEACHDSMRSQPSKNPCHGDQPSEQTTTFQPCQLSALVENRGPVFAKADVISFSYFFALLAGNEYIANQPDMGDVIQEETSPPFSSELVSTILRV